MHTLSHQTGDEVGVLDRPDPVTDPPGLQTVEDLPDAVGSGRLPRVDRERRTGAADDLEGRQVRRQRVARLVAGQVERHGQVLAVQRRGELRRPDALGLAVVTKRAENDRATQPVPLPGPGLLDHDLRHLTGGQVTLDVAQWSETRLGVQRIVGRQLRPQVPHAGSQANLGLQQFHVALGRVQERDERIEPLRADEVPPVGVGVDAGVQRRHRLEGHADVHVQVQLDGAAEPHRTPLSTGCWATAERSTTGTEPRHSAPALSFRRRPESSRRPG